MHSCFVNVCFGNGLGYFALKCLFRIWLFWKCLFYGIFIYNFVVFLLVQCSRDVVFFTCIVLHIFVMYIFIYSTSFTVKKSDFDKKIDSSSLSFSLLVSSSIYLVRQYLSYRGAKHLK